MAICLARNSNKTLLWGREEDLQKTMQAQRENPKYLPGIKFPESLEVTESLEATVKASKTILLVVPSHGFSQTLESIKPYLTSEHKLAWATKGLEPDTGRLLQEVARDIVGDKMPLAVLSGPTFAKEMAAGLPTAISVASTDDNLANEISELLHCGKTFRVYSNSDFIAIQLGGAVKNAIAIGAGMADGIGFGANARTALITRGLAEMSRLGVKLGAKPETFMGMSGLGDLVLTCTDNQSRNRRFGLALGQGKGVDEAMTEIGQVVEGYRNTKEVYLLAQKVGVEMPIVEQIYQVLYQGKSAKEAAVELLSRAKKFE